ncbi:MAG: guanylate kinase [Limnochordia bacterium]
MLFILSGPSGAGKNTLLNEVLKTEKDLVYSVSASTRPPRPHEQEGVHYFFLGRDEFEGKARTGAFLEWAEFCGHLYGTPKAFIDEQLAAGKKVILDIDIQGARQIRAKMPEAILVFLLPPNLSELSQRLRGRGTEVEEAIANRLGRARSEMEAIYDYDYVIINDDLSKAAQRLRAIIAAEGLRRERIDCEALIRQVMEGIPK